MATVGDDLDKVQSKLHDDGNLWSRAELLDWYEDGYGVLLADSQAVVRPLILDVPGRQAYAIVHPWEDRHAWGTFWQPFEATGSHVVTTLWEVEQMGDITPSTTLTGISYEWERPYTDETDAHYQFGLPRNSDRIARVAWDDRYLFPIETRELDHADSRWMKTPGRPQWWTTGTGRVTSIEIYEIATEYIENYVLYGYESGTPRLISGDRDNDFTL